MKKTLLAILTFQIITTNINAQENKSEIEFSVVSDNEESEEKQNSKIFYLKLILNY